VVSFKQRCVSGTVAKFIVSDWGDKVDYGIMLSYRPVTQCSLVGRCDNPMRQSTLYPLVRDYELGIWYLYMAVRF
jgi:hypothetical protein